MELVKCRHCGRYMLKGAQFCEFCKKPLKKSTNWKKIILRTVLVAVILAVIVTVANYNRKKDAYALGESAMAEKDYVAAQEVFRGLGSFRDSQAQLEMAVKGQHFTQGEAAFGDGDYETALEEFTAAGDFQDAAARAGEARKGIHYLAGKKALENEDAQTAIQELTAAEDHPGAERLLASARKLQDYQHALELMESGDYAQALIDLGKAEGHPGADDAAMECNRQLGYKALEAQDYAAAYGYLKKGGNSSELRAQVGELCLMLGKEALTEGDMEAALEKFRETELYAPELEPSLSDYMLLCKAEKELSAGSMSKGLEYYSQISQSFRPAEFDIAARRSILTRLKNFAQLEGTYISNEYDIRVSMTSGGFVYTNYYPEDVLTDQFLTVDCKLNADGTVDIIGSVKYYYFTEYVGYSLFYTDKSKTLDFVLEDLTWVPSSHRFDSSTVLHLTGAPRLQYQAYTNGSNASSSVTFTK